MAHFSQILDSTSDPHSLLSTPDGSHIASRATPDYNQVIWITICHFLGHKFRGLLDG